MSYKLKDPQYCPFCGGDDIWVQEYVGGMADTLPYAFCRGCGSRGPTGYYESKDAEAKWEERAVIKRKLRIYSSND